MILRIIRLPTLLPRFMQCNILCCGSCRLANCTEKYKTDDLINSFVRVLIRNHLPVRWLVRLKKFGTSKCLYAGIL